MKDHNISYWDNYYSSSNNLSDMQPPSQFFSFVASEISKNSVVLDIGCGSGRDTLFFSALGFPTIGIDASKIAIDNCNARAKNISSSARFICTDLEGLDVNECLTKCGFDNIKNVIIYTRFFLHAITDEQELNLLDSIKKIAVDKSVRMFAEFRTSHDESLPKETDSHFRRYISPIHLITKYRRYGLHANYFTEGFGLAKFKNDDAHVARIDFTYELD